jgi:hypothetical protein
MIVSYISWGGSLTMAVLLVTGYYLLSCKHHSWRQIRKLFTGKRRGSSVSHITEWVLKKNDKSVNNHKTAGFPDLSATYVVRQSAENTAAPFEEETYRLVKKIKAVIVYCATQHHAKRYLLDILQTLLKNYSGVKDNAFILSINKLVESELEKYGSYHLSPMELRDIWIP